MKARDALEQARGCLQRNPHDPGLAIYMIRDLPEIEQAGLSDLCWSLASGRWGCHKNDVTGVFELFEKWLNENEVENDDRRNHN